MFVRAILGGIVAVIGALGIGLVCCPAQGAEISDADLAAARRAVDACPDNPTSSADNLACEKKDVALRTLLEKGWCKNLNGSFSHCQKVEARDEDLGDAGQIFRLPLQRQLAQCEEYGAAGNRPMASMCRTETLNAYDLLVSKVRQKKFDLSYCHQWAQDLPLAARCAVAYEEICRPNSPQCFHIMASGAWVANPSAMSLDLSRPVRN